MGESGNVAAAVMSPVICEGQDCWVSMELIKLLNKNAYL
jgi:hypothetical protein